MVLGSVLTFSNNLISRQKMSVFLTQKVEEENICTELHPFGGVLTV